MLLFLLACSDVEKPHDHDHDSEMITTIQLSLRDSSDAESVLEWSDPELDGNPTVDSIDLTIGEEYSLALSFWNGAEDPAEELTEEIQDESEEHQIFFSGDVDGFDGAALISHSYLDQDSNGNPIGLDNSITALSEGEGVLVIGLRHIPEEDDVALKTANLLVDYQQGGESQIPGDWDIVGEFPLMVSAETSAE